MGNGSMDLGVREFNWLKREGLITQRFGDWVLSREGRFLRGRIEAIAKATGEDL